MSNPVIKVSNLSKIYRLGEVGTGTISHDLNRWWSEVRGKEDTYAKVGTVNDRTQKAEKGEQVWALRDINFEVQQGEVLGIIGKNGAGKSTLLKLLSRVTSPTTGEIKAKGRIASLLEVGTGFNPEMTGRENIYMNGTILGMRRREITAKLDDIVDFAGVAKYLDTPTKRYSSGMTVRLGFAVAAFLEPEILIVDEVLAVGDAEFQKKAIGKMQDISKGGGRTVLFVSHNMGSLQNLCTRAILLENGELTMDDSVTNTIERYLTEYTGTKNTLLNINDRKGDGVIRIKSVIFEELKSQKILNQLMSGQNIKIKVYYETLLNNLESFNIGISFYNHQGSYLIGVNNEVSGYKLFVNEEKYLECIINNFPLSEGRYTFNLIIYYKGEVTDYIISAGILNVVSGDYYGTGRLPASGRPGVLIKTEWK